MIGTARYFVEIGKGMRKDQHAGYRRPQQEGVRKLTRLPSDRRDKQRARKNEKKRNDWKNVPKVPAETRLGRNEDKQLKSRQQQDKDAEIDRCFIAPLEKKN